MFPFEIDLGNAIKVTVPKLGDKKRDYRAFRT